MVGELPVSGAAAAMPASWENKLLIPMKGSRTSPVGAVGHLVSVDIMEKVTRLVRAG